MQYCATFVLLVNSFSTYTENCVLCFRVSAPFVAQISFTDGKTFTIHSFNQKVNHFR